MAAAPDLRTAITAARSVEPRARTCSDDELLADTEAWEALGRMVDAHRIALAAELDQRSRPALGEQGLAFRSGEKDASSLVARIARVSVHEGRRRVGLGAALAPHTSLAGNELPGRYPEVAAAVRTGEVGLESARIVVETLRSVRKRAKADDLEVAERALTEAACEIGPDLLRVHAAVWQARVDPDGAEPAAEETYRARAFRLGLTGLDGTTTFSGRLPAEHLALVKEALQAHRRGVQMTRVGADDDDSEDLEPGWVEADGDRRTKPQYDFDTFFGTFAAGVRAEQDGSGGSLKVPHEVVIQVTAQELEQRRGAAWADGVLARLPIPAVERVACGGGTCLLVVDGASGEPLHLGRTARVFSPVQKKALAARYGGCAWPGCTAPVAWSDAHHIAWWQRDTGPTDVSNGVLLCSHHHHLIHAETCAWRIVAHEGEPHLVPRSHRGPPERRHRMQRHPVGMSRAPVADDPWVAARRR